jgi:plasmid replication initiation protein
MDTTSNAALVSDLRYALDVMEEYSHLGLNDEAASKLREILVRQINDARAALSSPPATPVRFPADQEKILA